MMERSLAIALGVVGTYLMYSELAFRRSKPRAPKQLDMNTEERLRRWMRQAGLGEVSIAGFLAASWAVGTASGAAAFLLFGAPVPALAVAFPAATIPAASYRNRRRERLADAHNAWPGLIEEIRVLTGSAGRSIPTALFEAGAASPAPLHTGFEAGLREWRVSTDFERTVAVLMTEFDDPTADATCETLLTAYEVGGSGIDRRLRDLAEDRRRDASLRAEATSKQAGVKFSRRFVLIVPAAMAFAGLSLGNGKASYQTPMGQALVTLAVMLIGICWWWSGRLLRIPKERRVLGQ